MLKKNYLLTYVFSIFYNCNIKPILKWYNYSVKIIFVFLIQKGIFYFTFVSICMTVINNR